MTDKKQEKAKLRMLTRSEKDFLRQDMKESSIWLKTEIRKRKLQRNKTKQ